MPTLREIARSLRYMLSPARVNRELDDELRFHLEMETRRYMHLGLSAREAQRRAQLEFGHIADVRHDVQHVHLGRAPSYFDSTMTDLRHVLRGLRLSPLFTFGAAATLALGIGANVTMFAVVERLLLRPAPFVVEPEKVLTLARHMKFQDNEFTSNSYSYPRYKALRDNMPGAAEVAAISYPAPAPMGRGEDARSIQALLTTGNYFRLLGTHPQLGRFYDATDDVEPIGNAVVVISDGLWKSAFGGDRAVLGRTVEIGPRQFRIIGVAPKGFSDMWGRTDAWVPVSSATGLQFPGADWATTKNSTWLFVLARPKPGVSPARMAQEEDRAYRADVGTSQKVTSKPELPTLVEHLRESRGADAKVSLLLSGVSVLVLLIACANLANLLLARALKRRREIAVRVALGASRARLAGQIMSEALVLALVGGVLGLFVARFGGSILARQLLDDSTLVTGAMDLRVGSYALLITLIAAAASSIVPAIQLSRPDVAATLKSGGRGSSERTRTRYALLVLQATFSVLLLVGAGLFVRSLRRVGTIDVGMDANRALIATMDLKKLQFTPAQVEQSFLRMAERVRAIPDVDVAAVSVTAPSMWSYGTSFSVPGMDSLPDVPDGQVINAVEPDYFKALGMRIVAGRAFTRADVQSGGLVAVINETLAHAGWPHESPVGHCLKIGGDTLPCTTIIGVAANSRRQNWIEKPNYHVHVPLQQVARYDIAKYMKDRMLVVRTRAMPTAAVLHNIATTMQTTDARMPYADVKPLATRFEREIRPWRLGATMFGAFGALALLLAAVGLYSVMAFSIANRTQELGVRMALGAQQADVLQMVLRQAIVLVAGGAMIGAVLALGGSRFIEPLLFQTSPHDPAVYLTAIGTIVGASLIAAFGPAWRATRVDPAVALRAE